MRKPSRANDFITRAECQALIVHTLNELFAQMEPPTAPPPAVVPAEPPASVS